MAHKGTKKKYLGRRVKATSKHHKANGKPVEISGVLKEMYTGSEGLVYVVEVMVPKWYVVIEESIRIK